MKYKRTSIFAIFIAALLVIASVTVFAADRYNASQEDPSGSSDTFQGSAEILLARLDDDKTQYTITCVNQISAQPELEFYIEGENIARVELYSQNEYLHVVDWTEQSVTYDPANSVTDFGDQTFSQGVSVDFEQDFTEYDGLWYRWWGYNLSNWASQNDYAHILLPDGKGESAQLNQQEAIALAGGDDGSGTTGLGHVQLDGYPSELLNDTITVVLTDREGNTCVRHIFITLKNDEKNQLNITARLEN